MVKWQRSRIIIIILLYNSTQKRKCFLYNCFHTKYKNFSTNKYQHHHHQFPLGQWVYRVALYVQGIQQHSLFINSIFSGIYHILTYSHTHKAFFAPLDPSWLIPPWWYCAHGEGQAFGGLASEVYTNNSKTWVENYTWTLSKLLCWILWVSIATSIFMIPPGQVQKKRTQNRPLP